MTTTDVQSVTDPQPTARCGATRQVLKSRWICARPAVHPDDHETAKGQRWTRAEQSAADLGTGLRRLAVFCDANPELAVHLARSFSSVLTSVGNGDDTRAVLASFARAALAADVAVAKEYDGDWFDLMLGFGPVRIKVYARREAVCERVVVGSETVIDEVPDPEAVAALPKVKTPRVVERVEWRCAPILADVPGDDPS